MNEQKSLSTSDLAGVHEASPEPATPPPSEQPADEARATQARTDAGDGGSAALFDQPDRSGFQERWMEIQTGFVDEPRKSVEQADALVAEAMTRLAETFARERETLEEQWGEGSDVGTEDLRVALQRYRSFFERLLAA